MLHPYRVCRRANGADALLNGSGNRAEDNCAHPAVYEVKHRQCAWAGAEWKRLGDRLELRSGQLRTPGAQKTEKAGVFCLSYFRDGP